MIKKIKTNFLIIAGFLAAFFIPTILFLNRFLIPDRSYDALVYHLFNAQRAFHNWFWQFSPNEFFPLALGNLSAFYDMLLYPFIFIFGYRLGTIPNLLAFFLITFVSYKIVNLIYPNIFKKHKLLSAGLLINLTVINQILLEVGTYKIDILNTLLPLTGTYFLLKFVSEKGTNYKYFLIYNLIFMFVFYGKITNSIVILPVITVNFYLIFFSSKFSKFNQLKKIIIFISTGVLISSLLAIHSLQNYILSQGNPFFPLYSGLFKSPYLEYENFADVRWGGKTLLDKIIWPILSIFQNNRLGEMHTIFYDFKLQFFWILGIISLVFSIKNKIKESEKILYFLFFSSMFLWSIVFGYSRYATFSEVLGGILLFKFLDLKYSKQKIYLFAFSCVILIFLIQNLRIVKFNFGYDWAFRPPLKRNVELHKTQIPYLFEKQIKLPIDSTQIDITLNCFLPNSGFYILSDLKNKPLINIEESSNNIYKFMANNEKYRTKVRERLNKSISKEKYNFAILLPDDQVGKLLNTCFNTLNKYPNTIENIEYTDSMMGFTHQKIIIVTGKIKI